MANSSALSLVLVPREEEGAWRGVAEGGFYEKKCGSGRVPKNTLLIVAPACELPSESGCVGGPVKPVSVSVPASLHALCDEETDPCHLGPHGKEKTASTLTPALSFVHLVLLGLTREEKYPCSRDGSCE